MLALGFAKMVIKKQGETYVVRVYPAGACMTKAAIVPEQGQDAKRMAISEVCVN